jgi:hypothetical protein
VQKECRRAGKDTTNQDKIKYDMNKWDGCVCENHDIFQCWYAKFGEGRVMTLSKYSRTF